MRKIFARILYYLYLKTLNKKKWIEGCELVFNIEGHNYYRYRDSGKIPLKRLEALEGRVIMLNNRLNKKEMDILMDIIETSIQNAIDGLSAKGKMNGLTNAIAAIQEMKSRKDDLIFHPGLLMEVAAIMIIRDDENPNEVNELLLNEKIELFRKSENHIDFFLQAGLSQYLPNAQELIAGSQQNLKEFLQQYEITDQMLKDKMEAYEKIHGKIKSSDIVNV